MNITPQSSTNMSNTLSRGLHWVRVKSWIIPFLIFNYSLYRGSSSGAKTEPSTFRLLKPAKAIVQAVTLGLLFTFSFFILQCGLDVEDPTPPAPPVWVPKSLPEDWPERGIDAHDSGGIILEWEQNSEEDIVAYEIYRAIWFDVEDSLSEFNLLAHLDVTSISTTEYVDAVAKERIYYYYKLKSVDVSQNMSAYSDSISYSLLSQIEANSMTPNGINAELSEHRILSWRAVGTMEFENYVITILTPEGGLVGRWWPILPHDYYHGGEDWHIPQEVSLDSLIVYHWRVDTGSRYDMGVESSGSESFWRTFIYAGDD